MIYLIKLHNFFFPLKIIIIPTKKLFKVEKHSLQRLVPTSQHILESLMLKSVASSPRLHFCSVSGVQPVSVSEVKYSHSDY